MWIQAVNHFEQKPMASVDESPLEEAQKRIPHEYWKYLNVFVMTVSSRSVIGSKGGLRFDEAASRRG